VKASFPPTERTPWPQQQRVLFIAGLGNVPHWVGGARRIRVPSGPANPSTTRCAVSRAIPDWGRFFFVFFAILGDERQDQVLRQRREAESEFAEGLAAGERPAVVMADRIRT